MSNRLLQPVNVLIEQEVMHPYRIPFYTKLAEQVNLLVLICQNSSLRDVNDVTNALRFPFVRSVELTENGFQYHKDVFTHLMNHQAQVYISNYSHLVPLCNNSRFYPVLQKLDIPIIVWGCVGYGERNFKLARFKHSPWYRLMHPRNWLKRPKSWPFIGQYPYGKAVAETDGFLTYSSLTSDYWQSVWRIPASKITVAHNAIDTTLLISRYQQLLASGEQRSDGKIVFVGRMTQGKGIDLLLKAYQKIKLINKDASMVLIGDGSGRQYLVQMSEELRLKDVEFKGEILDQQQLADELYHASLYVLPGLGGLGINTAMACGLPIICSQADGTEVDLVKEGRNGWFFESGNEEDLIRVLLIAFSNPDRLKQYGQESQRLVEHEYNLDNMVKAFIERINIAIQ